MIYIVKTQQNRRVEEILFDHNNENMDRTIWRDQLTYRKKEIVMAYLFIFITVVLVVSMIVLITANHLFNSMSSYPIILIGVLTVIFVFQFTLLMCLIRKYHNYEYKRIIKESIIFLACNLVFIAFLIVNVLVYVRFMFDG